RLPRWTTAGVIPGPETSPLCPVFVDTARVRADIGGGVAAVIPYAPLAWPAAVVGPVSAVVVVPVLDVTVPVCEPLVVVPVLDVAVPVCEPLVVVPVLEVSVPVPANSSGIDVSARYTGTVAPNFTPSDVPTDEKSVAASL